MQTALDACAICCSTLGPTGCFTTECGHAYHASCLEHWVVQLVLQGAEAPTCPSCRALLKNAPGLVAVRLVGGAAARPVNAFPALADVHPGSEASAWNPVPLDPRFVEVELVCDLAAAPRGRKTEATVLATLRFAEDHATVTPVDFVVLMDVSGSMEGSKLQAAKTALLRVSEMFNPSDRVALVKFDDMAMQVTPLAPLAHRAHNAEFKRMTRNLESCGGTSIVAALECAIAVLNARTFKNPLCHILLFTDGQDQLTAANLERLKRLSDAAGAPSWSTFGFGADHDATLLSRVAARGFGSFSFIEERASGELDEVFAAFAADATRVAACGVRVLFETLSPASTLLSVNKQSTAEVQLGNVAAGCKLEFLVKVLVEPDETPFLALRARVTGKRCPDDLAAAETQPVALLLESGAVAVQSDSESVALVDAARNAAVVTEATEAFAAALEDGCGIQDALEVLDRAALRFVGTEEAALPFLQRLGRMREDAADEQREVVARRAAQAHATGSTQRTVMSSPYALCTPSTAASAGVQRARSLKSGASPAKTSV